MNSLLRKIRRKLTEVAKNNESLRGPIRALMNLYRKLRYKLGTFWISVNDKTIVFASFAGESYSDNPKALFEYMVRDKRFSDYTFIWGFERNVKGHDKAFQKLSESIQNINEESVGDSSFPEIITVKYGSKSWRKYLARSKYWFFNFKVDDSLKPKKNQIFLQTWHGTPLKRLGFDLEHFDNVLNTETGMKKRYGIEVKKFDYFLSPSGFASEKFKSAWAMEAFKKQDIIIEEGYPRNDILTNYAAEYADEIKSRIFGFYYLPYEKLIKKKTIVLYAPTFRSNQHETGVGYVYKEEVDFEKLQRELGEDFIILFRAHYLVADQFDFERFPGFVYNVSKYDDINELFLISDILVTDYSSSMFDFAILKRPMIFYMYDLEHYRDESNGFYFNPEEELPGPIIKTDDELAFELEKAASSFKYDEKYRKFNEKFNPLDDGHVCERVIDRIFQKG